ncbi:MAG: hypothetical protein JNL98_14955 [Bryobacterales bacterium]|nr:hypothetical protein [Bryobacterales bacterium]
MPSFADPSLDLFMRVNLNWQEVFTAFREKETGVDFISLHVAKERLATDRELRREVCGTELEHHRYIPGGPDQINVVVPVQSFDTLISRIPVRRAIREFNLRLAKKGPCPYGASHCFDLADIVMGE